MNQNFTQREYEVLGLIARGYTSKQICEKLCITYSTLKAHLEHMYDKLHVKNKVTMLIVAFKSGLIEVPPKEENAWLQK